MSYTLFYWLEKQFLSEFGSSLVNRNTFHANTTKPQSTSRTNFTLFPPNTTTLVGMQSRASTSSPIRKPTGITNHLAMVNKSTTSLPNSTDVPTGMPGRSTHSSCKDIYYRLLFRIWEFYQYVEKIKISNYYMYVHFVQLITDSLLNLEGGKTLKYLNDNVHYADSWIFTNRNKHIHSG